MSFEAFELQASYHRDLQSNGLRVGRCGGIKSCLIQGDKWLFFMDDSIYIYTCIHIAI